MDNQRVTRWTRDLGDADLAVLLLVARSEVVAPVPGPVSERHMAAILDEATRMAAPPAPTAPPIETVHPKLFVAGVSGSARGSTASRSRGQVIALAGGWVRLATATAAAVLVLTTGLATTGTLPAAAQELVADMVALVGLEIPRPASAGPPPAATMTGPETAPSGHSGNLPPWQHRRDEAPGAEQRREAADRDTTTGRDQAPGQHDRDTTTGRAQAPGQHDRDPTTGRDQAPGQHDRDPTTGRDQAPGTPPAGQPSPDTTNVPTSGAPRGNPSPEPTDSPDPAPGTPETQQDTKGTHHTKGAANQVNRNSNTTRADQPPGQAERDTDANGPAEPPGQANRDANAKGPTIGGASVLPDPGITPSGPASSAAARPAPLPGSPTPPDAPSSGTGHADGTDDIASSDGIAQG